MKVLMIIPAYNEELNIENTINKIKKYKKKSSNEIDYIIKQLYISQSLKNPVLKTFDDLD